MILFLINYENSLLINDLRLVNYMFKSFFPWLNMLCEVVCRLSHTCKMNYLLHLLNLCLYFFLMF